MRTNSDLARARELTINLTLRELRGRYKRSVLGWAWSMLNPLATVAIFGVVFSRFLKIGPPVGDPSGIHNFAAWLVCGILFWNFFAAGLTGGMGSIVANEGLVKKVYFPREALVISSVASAVVTLAIEVGVVSVVLLLFGNVVFLWLPVVAGLIAIQAAFTLGLGLLLSVINVQYRDMTYLVGILLQAWFYATPVVYPIGIVEGENFGLFGREVAIKTILEINPMTKFVECYRDVLYDLRFPPLGDVLYLTAVSAVVLAIGWAVFNRREPYLAEEM